MSEYENGYDDLTAFPEALSYLKLRRLGYDVDQDLILLEGKPIPPEVLTDYKTDLLDLPTVNSVEEIRGAFIGAAGYQYIGRDTIDKMQELLLHQPEAIERIIHQTRMTMKTVFDKMYPGLIEDIDAENMLFGFSVGINDEGYPTFVTFGQCACLGYDPHGLYTGDNEPIESLTLHNIDWQMNQQLGDAQHASLTAGLAAYSTLIHQL